MKKIMYFIAAAIVGFMAVSCGNGENATECNPENDNDSVLVVEEDTLAADTISVIE